MSFLDNFSFAFQSIELRQKTYTENKYGESVANQCSSSFFQWVIQKKKDMMELSLDTKKNMQYTSKDYVLRSNVDITPKKWDTIVSMGNTYFVVFTEKVIIEWIHDHNLSIIRHNT